LRCYRKQTQLFKTAGKQKKTEKCTFEEKDKPGGVNFEQRPGNVEDECGRNMGVYPEGGKNGLKKRIANHPSCLENGISIG